MPGFLKVKNIEKYQAYKDGRKIQWVQWHVHILEDYDFHKLSDRSKLLLPYLLLIAARTNNKIPNDPKWVKEKIGLGSTPDFEELLSDGFLMPYNTVQDRTEPYGEEKRREEKKGKEKREKEPSPLPKIVSEKCIQKMKEEFPDEDIKKHLQLFYDYLPNAKRAYKDLDAAFRNCMRKGWYSFKKNSGDKYNANR